MQRHQYKLVTIALIIIALSAIAIFAQDAAVSPVQVNRYPVKIESVHDADTFTCTITMGWDVQLANQKVRVANFDAWEISRQRQTVGRITDEELRKGREATDYAKSLFSKAKTITVSPNPKDDRDVYGRPLVTVTVDGQDYGDLMKSKGFDRR